MTVLAELQTLETLIESAVADATCVVDRVAVTAGRPAAPSGDDCTAIFVFAENITDFNQADPTVCVVDSRLSMEFEIWVCYPEQWEDSTDADHLTAASCLYELMGLVWCALVDAKDSGEPFSDCQSFLELTPLQMQQRSGGMVSALGGLTLSYDCTAETSPSSP